MADVSATYEEYERKIASYMDQYHVNRRTAEHMLIAETGGDIRVDGEPIGSGNDSVPLNLLWNNVPERAPSQLVLQQRKPKRLVLPLTARPRHLGIVTLRKRLAESRKLSSLADTLRRSENQNHR